MKIGIIGLGIVGEACKFGFEKVGHTVLAHDIKLDTKIEDVLSSDVCFICLPTPKTDTGPDISVIESCLHNLESLGYKNPVVIKSTILPGTTAKLQEDVSFILSHSSEYLRERCNISDFIENHRLLLIGTSEDLVYRLVVECHGDLPKQTMRVSATESEVAKYYHNVLSGLRVSLANEFYDICEATGSNYNLVKKAVICSTNMPDIYLDVNDNCRGYSSGCLNRDIPNIIKFSKELGLHTTLLKSIEDSNDNYKKTPFSNTRE